MAIDEGKLNEFMGRFVHDFGAVMHGATVVVGDQLGLYKALAEGPATAEELARRTQTDARYLREWLSAQAASGYVCYEPEGARFSLTEEQAFALAEEGSPAFIPGAFQIAIDQYKGIAKMTQAMRTGLGVGWHEHDAALFHGTERFFRPGYAANLVIERARERAAQAGVSERVHFEAASAKDYPGNDYDLVAVFDCPHDMGDPVGASAHVKRSLKPDGAWMIVEPFANDRLEDNLNPVGRVFFSASTFICTPASRAQEVGLCLGAQAGEARMRSVVMQGGFTHFRRATQTPFNLIYEARP